MSIKKQYQEVYEFLMKNKEKTVKSVLKDLETMMVSKKLETTFVKNDKGEVTHIYCYYHKKWEPTSLYGKKKGTTTGYNSMCKEGANQWSKQNREYKKAREQLLMDVAEGKIKPQDILKEEEKLQKERAKIVPRKDKQGTDKKPA